MTSQFIGATALMKAAGAGRRNMVELLLNRGADVQAKDRVRAAIVPHCATDRGQRHWRSVDRDGVEASESCAHTACRRGRPCWRGSLDGGDGSSM